MAEWPEPTKLFILKALDARVTANDYAEMARLAAANDRTGYLRSYLLEVADCARRFQSAAPESSARALNRDWLRRQLRLIDAR